MNLVRLEAMRGTLLSLVLATALAAGCGSDGDGGGGSAQAPDAQSAAASPDAPPAATAAERAIRARFAQMLGALNDVDGRAACPLMSSSARQTFGEMAPDGACPTGFAQAFETGIDESRSPRIARIDVSGDRAAVFARVPGSDALQRAPFVKEDGEWKVHGWLTD